MKKIVLSFLLHHANKYAKRLQADKAAIYAIKDMLLKKYALFSGFEIQHLEGTSCLDCNGTGMYKKYSYYDSCYYKEPCWSCNATGMFRMPQFNQLMVYRFEKFWFHVPFKRNYSKTNPFPVGLKVIKGYIEYKKSKYERVSAMILFLLYNRKALTVELNRSMLRIKWRFINFFRQIKYRKLQLQDFIKANGSLEEISDLPF
jgi:hypothetical protein